MICGNCKKETARVLVTKMGERCSNCGGIKEAGGARTDGITTRNSFRIRTESVKHEADFLQPHVWDKNEKKIKVNDEFVKKYPKQSQDNYTKEELKESGNEKLIK